VAIANAVSDGGLQVMPEVLVTGGGGAVEGLAATLMRALNGKQESKHPRRTSRRKSSAGKSREPASLTPQQ
jgi:hypothetical protein